MAYFRVGDDSTATQSHTSAIIKFMGYEHLFSEPDLALLFDWLRETGELYMDLDRPHSGETNNSVYFVHSLSQLKSIVAAEKHREVSITLFREKQYPIRGTADEALLAVASGFIPDGEWFSILSLGDGPVAPCNIVGSGETHAELREDFLRLKGQNIIFGRNPFDQRNSYFELADDAWVVNSWRHPPQITKNRLSYAPFEAEPDRYRSQIAFW